ncbi:MAG: hypothetical protein WDW36_009070 [Sanguina aurantia]
MSEAPPSVLLDNMSLSPSSDTAAAVAAVSPPAESHTAPASSSEAAPAAEDSTGEDKPVQAPAKVLEFNEPATLHESGLTLRARYDLCRSVAEECISDQELLTLLERKPHIIAYDGFEPSGRMHIAQGVMKCINVNKLTSTGVHFKFWIADWFAQLNNKMGGDLKKIQTVGKYMIEVWKAVGMDLSRVEFLSSSEEINKRPDEYWTLVMDIARKQSLKRIIRCSQIMGRSENEDLSAAQIFYPCMQCADIFFLKADICQLGMDQRKVNMLAREYCDDIKRKLKPVILSHSPTPLHHPTPVVIGNPIIEYIKYIVLPWFSTLTILRSDSTGGNVTYTDMPTLEADFLSGALHPGDLKPAVTKALNLILQPVRDHFEKNAEAKELLKKVRSYKVTK